MTTDKVQTDSEQPAPERSMKRRGMFAAAWAIVAAAVLRKTTEPVEAISGTGPDGNFVLGSNSTNNGTNYASLRTQLVTGLNFSGNVLLDVDSGPFQSTGTVHAMGIQGRSRGTAAGVAGLSGYQYPAGFPANQNAGVYGLSSLFNTRGVTGHHINNGIGVLGQSDLGGIGVEGLIPASNSYSASTALYGVNASTYAGTSPGGGGFGVYGISAKGHGLVGAVGTAGAAAVVGAVNGVANSYAGAFYGPVLVFGNFTVMGGAKSAAVPHPDGTHRRLYCVESPESWFEDFGTGQLECGRAEIAIDPDFAALVDLADYRVFLTEENTHQHLIVTDRTSHGFAVEADLEMAALKGKRETDLNGTFSWRIVAKRRDIKGARLETVAVPPEPVLPPLPDNAV
jgi:hypothetical protein